MFTCEKCWEGTCICGEQYKNLSTYNLVSLSNNLMRLAVEKVGIPYFVVRSTGQYKKYADGFYGWDSEIHSEEQIFPITELPFTLSKDHVFILVGIGNKPSVEEVNKLLSLC